MTKFLSLKRLADNTPLMPNMRKHEQNIFKIQLQEIILDKFRIQNRTKTELFINYGFESSLDVQDSLTWNL